MNIRTLTLALIATGCTNSNRYNQGYDLDEDTGEIDSAGNQDTGGGQGESGDDGGDDGDDGDDQSDDGNDGGQDSGGSSADYCHNMYHPIHLSGWSKDFYAVYNDEEAESITYGLEPISTNEGSETFQYRDVVAVPSGESYDVTLTVTCDPDGQEGMFVTAWDGDITYVVSDLLPIATPFMVNATLSSPRQYLPPEYALGAVGTWDYSYTLTVQYVEDSGGTPSETVYEVTGTFAEVGFEDFVLFDGTTVNSYKLTNSYTMVESGFFGETITSGYIEQHYVKGLGLVKEKHSDSENGSIILLKSLTGYSGLEIED